MQPNLARRLTAEALGTTILLATVVGSGIMGERLANGNVAVALLANTIATGAILVAIILTLGQISGAHFNPAVSRTGKWHYLNKFNVISASVKLFSFRTVPISAS